MTATLFASVVISTLVSSVYSYSFFRQDIPNGDRVPNPCDPSTIWMGVGHQNPMGAGSRNPFGSDFGANGYTWNKTLCQKDSDGDGLTNGQELGDSNCTWSPGQSPARNTSLTHPGICEPLDSTMCAARNSWLTNCNISKFDCPAIKDPGVKNYTMRFPLSPVPAEETTYICYLFQLPNDTDADIIAIEPAIDNMEIMHHMLLFGCSGDVSNIPSNRPYLCGMGGGTTCTSLIGLWGFGAAGQCLSSQLGFRIGPTGYQHAVIQSHWNNPMKKPNMTDSSGMRIHYTTNLRPNRGEIMMVGQESLEIPPGTDNVTLSGSCSALCTKAKMNQSVYITASALHMHLLGKAGIIRLFRNGQLLQVIQEEPSYDYNTPKMIELRTPIEMKPGDSINVECTFDATLRNKTTYYGEGTQDEMCYGFFAYYPQIRDFTFCGQWKSIDFCGMDTILSERCDLKTFIDIAPNLPTLCSVNCSSSQCVEALNATLMTGCQQDEDIRERFGPQDFDPFLYNCSVAQQPASTVSTSSPSTVSTSSPSTVSTTLRSNEVPSHCSLMRRYSDTIPVLAFVVYIHNLF